MNLLYYHVKLAVTTLVILDVQIQPSLTSPVGCQVASQNEHHPSKPSSTSLPLQDLAPQIRAVASLGRGLHLMHPRILLFNAKQQSRCSVNACRVTDQR